LHGLDVVITKENEDGEKPIPQVRGKDHSGLATFVSIADMLIAGTHLTENNDVQDGFVRSVWQAQVAGGVDLAVVTDDVFLWM
jgi:hypothetical protein